MDIYVVIPAYNEEQKIVEVVKGLQSSGYKNIVVVDDASSDLTYQKAQHCNDVVVLQHVINRGQGAALATGTQYALSQNADYIVHFDADGQMNAQDIPKLIDAFKGANTVDVVIGSRFGGETKIPPLRKFLLWGIRVFNRFIMGVTLRDPQSGFRVLSRHAAEMIEIKQDRMAHCSQMMKDMHQKKLKIVEVPVTIVYTEYSLGKGQSFKDVFKVVWELFLGSIVKH